MGLGSCYTYPTTDCSMYFRDPVNISPWMFLDRKWLFLRTASNLLIWTSHNIKFLIIYLKQQHRHCYEHHSSPLLQQLLPPLALLGQANMYIGLKESASHSSEYNSVLLVFWKNINFASAYVLKKKKHERYLSMGAVQFMLFIIAIIKSLCVIMQVLLGL